MPGGLVALVWRVRGSTSISLPAPPKALLHLAPPPSRLPFTWHSLLDPSQAEAVVDSPTREVPLIKGTRKVRLSDILSSR